MTGTGERSTASSKFRSVPGYVLFSLVGILDAFMDSKGLITPEQWRRSCDEIVALAEFPSYCWVEGDNFVARLAVDADGPFRGSG